LLRLLLLERGRDHEEHQQEEDAVDQGDQADLGLLVVAGINAQG
jgi:hypothetical protein